MLKVFDWLIAQRRHKRHNCPTIYASRQQPLQRHFAHQTGFQQLRADDGVILRQELVSEFSVFAMVRKTARNRQKYLSLISPFFKVKVWGGGQFFSMS